MAYAGENGGENGHGQGSWMTAMNSSSKTPAKPKRLSARFSSFRHPQHHPQQQQSTSSPAERGRSDRHEQTEHDESDSDHLGNTGSPAKDSAQRRWSLLRSRVLPAQGTSDSGPTPGVNKVTALAPATIASVPITTELLAGQLPVMILKTWLDRDEDGNRAVPVLLGNLRFRVGDSVGIGAGRETGKEMFKLECEYGDGVVKWVRPACRHR